MKLSLVFLTLILLICCQQPTKDSNPNAAKSGIEIPEVKETSLIVLGVAQDAGIPQAGCQRSDCADKFLNPDPLDAVVSLGLIDTENQSSYLFEATPDISKQLYWLQQATPGKPVFPSGIFITHAHIGHYTGLIYLGKESASTDKIPTYVMPRMEEFLTNNGPWDALVNNENIALNTMDSTAVVLTSQLQVTPLKVPHRDEYSETVGFHIKGSNKSALFIPDIDKWHLWEESIAEWIKKVDYAFLDATFYSGDELGGRDMSLIPHPSIEESMALFESLDIKQKQKVHFIHFNYTNPVLRVNSEAYKEVRARGYNIAGPLQVFPL